jgi:hypothetical protein
MAATTTKRKTAPRKPAVKRATTAQNGQATNGQTALGTPVEFVPREPEESIPLVAAVEAVEVLPHPYGDRRVQVFTPSEGEPIVVPHISSVNVTEEFLWDVNRQNLDMMRQSWAWMNLAEIPEDIQRRVVRLGGEDKKRFWAEWFQGFVPPQSGAVPGES